jgi:hypothetical protein
MIGNVVVPGLSAAVNPILVGVVLVTLASPRPKALLGAYVAGAMTFSVGLGIGAVALASSTGAVTPTTSTSPRQATRRSWPSCCSTCSCSRRR